MTSARKKGFASIVIDVDSTLCGVEGIDWLASRHAPATGVLVAALTERAMRGDIALDDVYGQRLALVRPSADDLAALAVAYEDALAPGAERAVKKLLRAGRRVVLVSGGLREAILPVAIKLGLHARDVCAVSVQAAADGSFEGYDHESPLCTAGGKRRIVETLELETPILAVGDGATDLAMRPVVDAFAAFTGFVRRAIVVEQADHVLTSFTHLAELALA